MARDWIQLAKLKASITRRMMAFKLSVMDRKRLHKTDMDQVSEVFCGLETG